MSKSTSYTYNHQVAFHETDAAGLVHFSNYFRWMEAAEHAFLNSLQVPIFEQEAIGVRGWPKLKCSAVFHVPLHFGDMIEVDLFIQEIKTRAVAYGFHFYRVTLGERTKVGSGELTTVFAEKNKKTEQMVGVDIPDSILKALDQWVKNSG